MGTFKVNADRIKKKTRPKSFRLPEELLRSLEKIADKKGLSVNELVNQMLQHCLSDLEKEK